MPHNSLSLIEQALSSPARPALLAGRKTRKVGEEITGQFDTSVEQRFN